MSISRINPVSNSNAQTTKLCRDGSVGVSSSDLASAYDALVSREPEVIGLIVTLLYYHGLRVSEVLSLNAINISSRGTLLIKGCKGSSDRIIVIPEYRDFLIRSRSSGVNLFGCYNRFFVYRLLKKYNYISYKTYGGKSAVCHAGRYAFVKDVNGLTQDIELTASVIGHKNSSNTKKYVKNGK